ncbi:MAG: glycosyltransferase family 2 protein [Candidatus Rokubacteria bacterium]|nr:glycosyltransferase family 2 protein [Candidatus Rokubacteria bacterium]
MTLSVVVITWNEEERLRPCLESAAWADEIVIVDAESTDKTVQVAREFTDRIWVRPWPGFAAQKNFALEQAAGEWLLSLDADEQVTPELKREIEGVIARSGPADGYAIPRKNFFWGAWARHGGLYPDYQLRLFRRGKGRFVARAVHESVAVQGPVGRLEAPLLHRSYRSLEEFIERSNRYSTLAAQEWIRSGGTVGWADLVVRPLARFLAMYVLRGGFLDGRRGLLLAGLYAHYVFLRTAKVLEMSHAR